VLSTNCGISNKLSSKGSMVHTLKGESERLLHYTMSGRVESSRNT